MARNPQLNAHNDLQNLLSIEGLSKALLHKALDTANGLIQSETLELMYVRWLKGLSVFNLFFDSAPYIQNSFEIAAKRLSAEIFNVSLAHQKSSIAVREALNHAIAMNANIVVVRHSNSGTAHFAAQYLPDHIHVINAGDGQFADPTRVLHDMLILQHIKKSFTDIRVALVGDILHSALARSHIHALSILGVPEIRVIAPKTLLPAEIESLGVHIYSDLETGLKDMDVVIVSELPTSPYKNSLLPSSAEYFHTYGLTENRLKAAHPEVCVLSSGKLTENIEISATLALSINQLLSSYPLFGVAIRMAIMAMITQKIPSLSG
ncbi:MAG: aspartate carbamoyltransferase catalytic subunit [Pseudomonadota bacterium]